MMPRIQIVFICLVLLGCNKDPYDKKLTRQWAKTEIDNSGNTQTISTLIFIGDGTLYFDQDYTSWQGQWSTDDGQLNISFEQELINGSYNYKVKNKGGGGAINGVAQSAITELDLTPISIDDSLERNNIKGIFNAYN
jgi:hypothetical protein